SLALSRSAPRSSGLPMLVSSASLFFAAFSNSVIEFFRPSFAVRSRSRSSMMSGTSSPVPLKFRLQPIDEMWRSRWGLLPIRMLLLGYEGHLHGDCPAVFDEQATALGEFVALHPWERNFEQGVAVVGVRLEYDSTPASLEVADEAV